MAGLRTAIKQQCKIIIVGIILLIPTMCYLVMSIGRIKKNYAELHRTVAELERKQKQQSCVCQEPTPEFFPSSVADRFTPNHSEQSQDESPYQYDMPDMIKWH